MEKTIQNILVLLLILNLSGCYYDNFPELPPPRNVSFQNDIQPIFNQSCISCHDGSLFPDLRAENSYNELINEDLVVPGDENASELFKRLNGDGSLMPPGSPLSQSNIKLVGQWINEGAKNN